MSRLFSKRRLRSKAPELALSQGQRSDLLTTREVAEFFGVCEDTIQKWRETGRGPRYIKIEPRHGNGIVRYRLRDVEAFVEKSLMSPDRK